MKAQKTIILQFHLILRRVCRRTLQEEIVLFNLVSAVININAVTAQSLNPSSQGSNCQSSGNVSSFRYIFADAVNDDRPLNADLIVQSETSETANTMDADVHDQAIPTHGVKKDQGFHSPPSCRLRRKRRVDYKVGGLGKLKVQKSKKRLDNNDQQ